MDYVLTVFKALSDRNRLRIYSALMHYDELCACQIVELLEVAGATASKHLSQLVSAGLLESRKEGRWIHYRLSNSHSPTGELRDWIRSQVRSTDTLNSDLESLNTITTLDREDLCRKQRGETCCPVKPISDKMKEKGSIV